MLQFHWINEFSNSLRNTINNMKKLYISFGKVQVYFNETKTRIFIGLQISADQLQNCVNSIDAVLKEFNQPTFYKTPKFHTSLLWCLPVQDKLTEAPQDIDNSSIMRLQEELHSVIEEINKEIHTAIENEVL